MLISLQNTSELKTELKGLKEYVDANLDVPYYLAILHHIFSC